VRRLVASLLFVVVASAGLGGCSRSKGEAIVAKPLDPALSGRFYATAGPGESQSDLYEAQFHPDRLFLFQLTKTGRTFGVDGCDSALTVDVAGQDVDFQDALRRFETGAILGIDGLDDARAALMSVAPDCRVLYLRLDRSTTPPTGRLMVFDPVAKNAQELHAAASPEFALGIADWGPSGRVAVFEGTAATEGHPSVATGIVVIAPDGSKRTIAPPVAGFGTLQWGASKWMAISDEVNRKTVFIDPDSGARAELAGWFPLAWSPDGQRLIVTDAPDRKTLGLVDSADLTKARVVGHAKKAAFFDLLWLPETATAGGPPPAPGRRPDDGD
jgi:hypothetical protein